ncbi:hypothetical protein NLU13_7306 [Sarocladium strictum]|uniref:Aldehyde dehydrogenase domain-containing protein n=1 Tax=Sarocladium strictum TaxID=5046 RepID=A0AA39L5E9_SARSR|nr:hypothetical protein NLU13_7306 [Sarocladium strictum]
MSRHADDAIARLQETVADGRLANPVYRREQLAKLLAALIDSRESIKAALVRDTSVTQREAFAEIYQTLAALRSHVDETAPDAQLAAEYSIAEGRNAVSLRQGLGIVALEPQSHTPFFSIFSPLGAAVAAGNPVVLVLKKTLHHLPALVQNILQTTLDPGLVAIVPSEPANLQAALNIRQISTREEDNDGVRLLASPSDALTVAVVDRTSNVDAAARAVWSSRTAYGTASPYAPDVVLVNEFSKNHFVKALLDQCLKNHDQYPASKPARDDATQDILRDGSKSIASGAWGQVIELTSRSTLNKVGKLKQRAFYIYPYRSLEDALELANGLTSDALLATYAFGDRKTCKYLLQFVDSDVGFANAIPTEVLVGPAAPRSHPIQLTTRYSTEMLSTPRPRYAEEGEQTQLSSVLAHVLTGRLTAVQEDKILSKLRPEKRKPANPGIGYFERGVLVGGATVLLPLLGGVSAAAFFAARIVYRKYVR